MTKKLFIILNKIDLALFIFMTNLLLVFPERDKYDGGGGIYPFLL
jgi:hypothetical protein